MVGKYLDPGSRIRIRFLTDRDPFKKGSSRSELLGILRRRGVVAFLRECKVGEAKRMLGVFMSAGLVERIKVD